MKFKDSHFVKLFSLLSIGPHLMKEVVKIRGGTVPFFRLKRGSMLGGEERVDGDFASGG